jgi:hypothetical protein
MWIRYRTWLVFNDSDFHFPADRHTPGEFFAAGSKTGNQRGGLSTGRKTTARSGTAKSPAARAVSHRTRSSAAGRAKTSSGSSRTVGRPAQTERNARRGPGDVGAAGGSRDRAGRSGGAPKRAK